MTELNTTLRQWLVADESIYVEQDHAEHRVFRFEVPTNEWTDDIMPLRGSVTPIELGGVGTVLTRRVDYRDIPGSVVCILTCGWSGWAYFDSLTRVSCQTVTVRKEQPFGSDGTTPITGPVTGEEETQRYGVDESGRYEADETYVQINITSIVSGIPAGWQGSNFGKRNQAAVTIRGVLYELGKVLYAGGGSEDVPASQSPTGVAAYRLSLRLLAAKTVWPLTVPRYLWKKRIIEVPTLDVDGVDIGKSRTSGWVKTGTVTNVIIRGEFDMATALASLP